ncbi:tyrosine-type recombinase/integrase [Methanothrix harundinacea]|uniref:Tyr recombinase domain-containing protein n=1 Tax=Methanothrix harundinacea (strain 6Ac) TaxID=1110509 RepID=G7WR49_METH6|nr:site-specific integrase [Methanothrix harundinacea]AET65352.1 hypothetical protein Mhar_1996 [Methanothrix harundinacea 6Ac]
MIEASADGEYWIIWQLMALCGLRSVEAVNLTYGDIDLERRLIHVGKTSSNSGKSRTVIYPECLQEVIEEQLDRHRHLYRKNEHNYFIAGWWSPLSTRAVRYAFQKYSDMAGIEGYSPHSLRHFYAESLVRKGVDLDTIRKNLGVSILTI